ncbi:TIM barrel protein [Devosia sp.]|uniref:TIM barrel protein n=1 Tax=Devosia sp. TaxID=1871048 RepID=UPI001A0A320D|nr:TIM barrel protein [Devosia sp.]MBE0579571.1 TIM barrel protein [Devosia sp.]
MIAFSVCIETAFTEDDGDFPQRVRAAAASGFNAVEIWDWWTKPLAELRNALRDTGTALHTLCVEDWRDKCRLGDAAARDQFVERVQRAAAAALDLGTPNLVVLPGDRLEGVDEAIQHHALMAALDAAAIAIAGSGLTLLLEVVNRQFEGPNALVRDSRTALDLLRRLGRPDVAFLYDRYHAILNAEPLGWAIETNMDLIGHVQAADVPGRHEFGTGTVDWAKELHWLGDAGYTGFVGIEAIPLGHSRELHAQASRLLVTPG